MLNLFRKFRAVKAAFVFVLVGILFLVLGIVTSNKVKNSDTVYVETTGVISSITVEKPNKDETIYTVLVDYEADGVIYEDAEYGSYDSSMKEGDEVTVLYNQDDPTDITYPGFEKLPTIICIAGALAIVFGIGLTVKTLISVL